MIPGDYSESAPLPYAYVRDATLPCPDCDGAGETATVGVGHPPWDPWVRVCERCDGRGTRACDWCGDPATVDNGSDTLCDECAREAEDAAD